MSLESVFLSFSIPCNFSFKTRHDVLGKKNCGKKAVRVRFHIYLAKTCFYCLL